MSLVAAETCIYGLVDPRTNAIRYVGKTNRPRARLRAHIAAVDRKPCHKSAWIKSLLALEIEPTLVILEEIPPGGDWAARERDWIAALPNLTNQTAGGEGTLGRTLSAETREKIRAKALEREPAHGRVATPEQRAAQAAKMRGRTLTAEHRAKISEANRRRWAAGAYAGRDTPEYRARVGQNVRAAHERGAYDHLRGLANSERSVIAR